MIVTILIWVYIAGLSFLYGGLGLVFYRKATKEQFGSVPVSLIVIFGMVILATLGMWFSLFIKLGLLANLFLVAGVYYLRRQSIIPPFDTKWNWQQFFISVIALLVFITVLENSTHTTANADTALYHAQTIRWIENYKVVPGLGNLHMRLAFNSSWLLLNALFSFSFLGDVSFHVLMGFFALFAIFYFLHGGAALLQREYTLSNILSVLLIPILFYVQGDEIKSPGTDLPATLLIWLIVIIWLEFIASTEKKDVYVFILVALAAFAITVKISTFPIIFLALSPIFIFWQKKEWRKIQLLFGTAGFILLPWLARNLILSGYLIFPFPGLDLFNFEWKTPLERVQGAKDGIVGFARSLGKNWVDTPHLSFNEWYPFWFQNHTSNQKLIFQLALYSPLGILYQWLTQNWIERRHQYTKWAFYSLYLVLYCGLFFWLLQAPSFRFGYGFLVSLILVGYMPLLVDIFLLQKRILQPLAILFFTVIVMYTGYFLSNSVKSEPLNMRLLFPMPYSPSDVIDCPLADLQVFCTRDEYRQCHYDAFPCIISLPPNLISRDGTLQGGFRFSP